MRTELRALQVEAIDAIREAVREGHRRIMFQLPTAGGKTRIAVEIIQRAFERGKRSMFCVPAISLVDQTVAALHQNGMEDVGVIQAMHELSNWDMPIQVASIQTLQKRQMPPGLSIVFVDEAHIMYGYIEKMLLDPANAHIIFIGLSATPWSKGLGAYYTKLIVGATTQQLIDNGTLSDFKVFGPSSPDLSGVHTARGDYVTGELSKVMQGHKLVADVVETWFKQGQGRPTICFGVDRAHAMAMQLKFQQAGVTCGYVDAFTKRQERKRLFEQLGEGALKVICNVGVMTTGIDLPFVSCLIMARPTKSETLFVQIVGRGLRRAPNKDHCLILDHSDNHERLGFVTDILHEELDDGKEKPKAEAAEREIKLPKPCPQCKFLKAPGISKCPMCGFVCVAQPADIAHAEGELAELKRNGRKVSFEDKRKTFAMLLSIAARRGRAQGWASWKYREMYGVWPNGISKDERAEPTTELLNWVKSRDIAFVKSRAKNETGAATTLG